MTMNGYFMLNFVFQPVCLTPLFINTSIPFKAFIHRKNDEAKKKQKDRRNFIRFVQYLVIICSDFFYLQWG